MDDARQRQDLAPAIAANGLVLTMLALAGIVLAVNPDLYYRSVQEDEALEWATFWSFILALGLYAVAASRSYRAGARAAWFLGGLALFSFLVAMEEISWGQRLIGYRPPAYLLEHNFQQEMNVHNLVDGPLRKAAFLGVVLGYGVLLPALARIDGLGTHLARLGVVGPSPLLVPAFAATAALYAIYPWTHSGEWAELMLGSCMLFAASLALRDEEAVASGPSRGAFESVRIVAPWLGAILLGLATATAWQMARVRQPEQVELARIELAALRRDVASARTKTQCGLHKRIYTLVDQTGQTHLHQGHFAGLVAGGLPEERASFFLDPWNSPYWVRHVCAADWSRRAIYVYSFGPNRRRDTTEWEIVEDDVGAWISRPPAEPLP